MIARPVQPPPDPPWAADGLVPRETASPGPGRFAGQPGAAIAVRGLTRCFRDRVACRDLTFDVGRGEVFGLLGPNGAGKTTTVRVLCTLLPPTSGAAEVAGIPLVPGNEREIRRRIGVMTEAAGLYLRLTVCDNLEFFAGLAGIPARRIEGRISECLALVGVGDRAGDRAGALSRGLRQRVALARALLPEPEVLFLDEPTAGLDPAAAAKFRRLVAELRERGTTVFLTTHRLDEAERCCDRIAIVNTRLVSVGPVAEVLRFRSNPRLDVALAAPLSDPAAVFGSIRAVASWRAGPEPGAYLLDVADPVAVAPEVARAVVMAGGSLVRLAEPSPSLEDAYLDAVGAGR